MKVPASGPSSSRAFREGFNCQRRNNHQQFKQVTSQEYDDYTPEHPELIPGNEQDAGLRLKTLTDIPHSDLSRVERQTFLQGWWALFWLYPGLHPDDHSAWDEEFHPYQPLAHEAFRRADAGELDDGQLYPTDAAHNRLWLAQQAAAQGEGRDVESDDRLVLIRNSEGLYLSRDQTGAIAWVAERSSAFRYYRKADAVDAQVREVKRLYDRDWIIELADPVPGSNDLAGCRVFVLTGPDAGQQGICLGPAADGRRWQVSVDSAPPQDLLFEQEFNLLLPAAGGEGGRPS